MIEILEQSTADCLAVRFSGKVTGEEYRKFLDAATERLKAGGRVSLVLELSDFEFHGDFEAAKEDVEFAFGEYRRFHRVALVGNQKWLVWFARLIDPFTRTEEKHFSSGQMDEALAWAQTE